MKIRIKEILYSNNNNNNNENNNNFIRRLFKTIQQKIIIEKYLGTGFSPVKYLVYLCKDWD